MKKKVRKKSAKVLAVLLSAMVAAGSSCTPILAEQIQDGEMQEIFSIDGENFGKEQSPVEEYIESDFDAQDTGAGFTEPGALEPAENAEDFAAHQEEQDAPDRQMEAVQEDGQSGFDAIQEGRDALDQQQEAGQEGSQSGFDTVQEGRDDAALTDQGDTGEARFTFEMVQESQGEASQADQGDAVGEGQDHDAPQAGQNETGMDTPAVEGADFAAKEDQNTQDPQTEDGQIWQEDRFEYQEVHAGQGESIQAEQGEAAQAGPDKAVQEASAGSGADFSVQEGQEEIALEEDEEQIAQDAQYGCEAPIVVSVPANQKEETPNERPECEAPEVISEYSNEDPDYPLDPPDPDDNGKIAISNSNCVISLSSEGFTYNGTACRPSVTVKQGSRTLSSGTDYTVSYKDNINAGTANVTITGKGNYTGSVSRTFTIRKADQTISVSAPSTSLKAGAAMQLTVSGTGSITYASGNTSVATVSTSGLITGKTAGTATITVTAAGNANYNSAKKTIAITVTKTYSASVFFSESSISLQKGSSKVLTVSAKGDLPDGFYFNSMRSDSKVISTEWTGGWINETGISSHDITINALEVGTATVTVYIEDADSGEYVASGTLTVTVTAVSPNTITPDCVKLSSASYTYNGKAKKPAVTVKVNGKKLKKDTHYTVSYSNNKNAGTAAVTVKGKGKYSGTVKKTFTIKKAAQGFYLSKTSYTFKKSSLKKKAQTIRLIGYKYKGTLIASTSSQYISISNGIVSVKKGTPKGTYKFTVRASGNANYKAKEVTVTVKVK